MSTAATTPFDPRRLHISHLLLTQLIVEATGAFALMFMGGGAIIMTQGQNLVAIALAHGLAIGLMIAATAQISGGAFNPAITLALYIAHKIDTRQLFGYTAAQLLGAAAAASVLTAIFPSWMTDAVTLATPVIGNAFTPTAAFLAETITTFFLAYVIFGTLIDKRGSATIGALVVGLAITMAILATGNVSGAAMNPARWFGPALISGHFENAWVWICGPLIGASLGAVLYFYGYMRGKAAD